MSERWNESREMHQHGRSHSPAIPLNTQYVRRIGADGEIRRSPRPTRTAGRPPSGATPVAGTTTTHQGPWRKARHFTSALKGGATDAFSNAWGGGGVLICYLP